MVAHSTPERSVTPPQTQQSGEDLRAPKLTVGIVMFLAGLAITFTGQLHLQVGFVQGLAVITLAALTLAYAYAWWLKRRFGGDLVSLLLALASFGSAIAALGTRSTAGLAMVIAVWALISGLLEFVGAVTVARQDATIMGGLGLLLSIAVLLVHRDPVAVIGFFGAYVLIGGVFLSIAAFDARAATARASKVNRPGPQTDALQESKR